jgi:hypothetical protein
MSGGRRRLCSRLSSWRSGRSSQPRSTWFDNDERADEPGTEFCDDGYDGAAERSSGVCRVSNQHDARC